MRIAIVGAGAVGSVIAGYLHAAGLSELAVLTRGQQLAAIRAKGLTVLSRGRLWENQLLASDDPVELGPQDVLISTAKAYSLPAIAPLLGPMMTPHTAVVAAQNGIPWWFFYGLNGQAQPFETVDTGGAVWRAIGPERAIGAVVYMAAKITEPGVVQHDGNLRLVLGAPRPDDHAEVLASLAHVLNRSGIEVALTESIRDAVWGKLMMNVGASPVALLTGAKSGEIDAAPWIKPLRIRLMRECLAVAHAWGSVLPDDVEERVRHGPGTPHHKGSMLQDYEAGRPVELDAIITSVLELGRRCNVAAPTIEAIWALSRLKVSG
jgi:2-dehydropantoate 2-reductase